MRSTAVLDDKSIIIIAGPTASGKTDFAIKCAQKLNGEIISADSRQIYRYLALGTAQPTDKQRKAVRHHLIDFLEPDRIFDTGTFVRLANQTIQNILKRGKRPIIVGGTGLYIKALVDGLAPLPQRDERIREKLQNFIQKKGLANLYNWLLKIDPETAEKIDPKNPARIIRAMEVYLITGKGMAYHHNKTKPSEYSFNMIGLNPSKDILMKRIVKRTSRMLKDGMIEETKKLLK
ncbi:MAG: tRNA (adenosine(37)-N6)-dimethylallyltransferase MiaA, partial [bacterium]